MSNLLELRWEADSEGYDALNSQGEPATTPLSFLKRVLLNDDSAHVVARGGPPRPFQCKADDFRILRDLLNMPNTPEGVLAFVEQWGLLGPPSDHGLQLISTFFVLKDGLADILLKGVPPHAGDQILAKLDLVYGPTGAFSLRANTLLDFLWAQVSLGHRQGALFQCPICKRVALRKTPRRSEKPKTKLGRMPQYCSDACKAKAYRQGRVAPASTGSSAGQESTLDLAAWARGDCEYHTTEVRLAIAGRFGKLVADRREALDLLIDKGVVPAAEARQDL